MGRFFQLSLPPPSPPMPHGTVSQPTTPAVWSSPATTSSTRPALSPVHQWSTSSLVTVLSSTVTTPSPVTTVPHPMSTSFFSSLNQLMPMETSTTPPAGMLPSHALTPPDLSSWRTSTTTATPRTATTTSRSPTLTTVTFLTLQLSDNDGLAWSSQ